ncbi:DNA repair protein RecN [Flavobacteriaceae bacterium PRS1]|nr:DNA repair protein RecN [Flavobacteriaceae bacterium PRS1]
MITSLFIKNYALIDHLQVNFSNGLTIITGETGAGKSILLGGLSLILGKRADVSHINDASKKCIIEATFDIANYNLKAMFNAEDLDYESETIIRREILPSGKSRAFVNDSPVNLNTLTILGKHLIDIHSQHQTLELTNNDFQFQIIDALANNQSSLREYKQKLKEYKETKVKLEKLNNIKAEAIKEHDYNTFLLKELEEANLVIGELESLEIEYETLSNVEEIKEGLTLSNQLLSDEQVGVLTTLATLKSSLYTLSELSGVYKELYNRINSTLIELDDLFSDLESAQEKLEVNPNRLEQVNTKLQAIHNLILKHSVADIDELINIQITLSNKVALSENIDEDIELKLKELNTIKKELDNSSKIIHDQREKAIPQLVFQLENILADLGMENAKFDISVKLENEYLSNGKDSLLFLFMANKGGEFKPLKKAVSGGELSRIMLAIKSILSKYIQLPSIMFDEIDSGISGEISNKMATIMLQMSKTLQVFTITHIPQIAAKGDSHFKVYKEDINNKTTTHLQKLNNDERIVEIAQMLGGEKMSGSAIAHAKQLLN